MTPKKDEYMRGYHDGFKDGAKGSAMPTTCEHCRGEPEPGWIETLNNGPIVPCPACNPKTQREIEYDRALLSRNHQGAA